MDDVHLGQSVNLKLRSDPQLMAVVRSVIRAFSSLGGFEEARSSAITLAVDEACTNVIRHAYGGRIDGDLSITCGFAEDDPGVCRLVVRIHDRGLPAPRECLAPPAAEKDLREPGGLGLRLIHEVMDCVEFNPCGENGNILELSIRCPDRSEPAP